MPKQKKTKRLPVTKERALDVAIALADAEGLEALTMRRLAQDLKVEAMSLYHHFANKDAILDGMIDRVFAEMVLPEGPDWKAAIRARQHSARAALRKHRWAVAVIESRRNPGPASLTHHDAVLGCLRAGGLSIPLTAHAYALLDAHLFGFVLQENTLPFETPEETQALATQILASQAADAFPHLAELTREHILKPGYAYADEFDYGLELILDGLTQKMKTPRPA